MTVAPVQQSYGHEGSGHLITGIIVPADEDQALKVVQVDAEDLPTMQAVVGGTIEAFNFDSPAVSLFANDEAMLYELPHNLRATLLLWQHSKGLRGQAYITGDAILVGMPDGRGRTKSVPSDFVKFLTETEAYHVEFLHHPEGPWYKRAEFKNWPDAYNHALVQVRTYATIRDARVVGA